MKHKHISGPLRDAEKSIGIALSRMSIEVGGIKGWPGSMREYKRIARLMCKTRELAEYIERTEDRIDALHP